MARRGIPQVHADIPNLAPMVDVVMVILIFFMLGTTFAISEGVLPTQLPSQIGPGGGSRVTIIPAVRIALLEQPGGECKIVVMEHELRDNSFEALHEFMRSRIDAHADPSGRIMIGAEPGVEYQHVISAMDACVRAGFNNIQFSVSSAALTALE